MYQNKLKKSKKNLNILYTLRRKKTLVKRELFLQFIKQSKGAKDIINLAGRKSAFIKKTK